MMTIIKARARTRIATLLSVVALQGCAATMLAGGVMDNEIEVTLDNNSIPGDARGEIIKARTLGVISSDRSSIRAADIFESKGGYTVRIDRQTAKVGEMTGSERREALSKTCQSQRVDVALLGRVISTETGSAIATAFTGRAKINQKWIMDVFACSTGTLSGFGGNLNLNVGVYNGKSPAEVEEKIGAEIANKILAALGKNRNDSAGTSLSDTSRNPTSSAGIVASSAVEQGGQTGTGATAVSSDSVRPGSRIVSLLEAQQILQSLGYSVGKPDGVSGKRTFDALKKFQADNRLLTSGALDEPTTQTLLAKRIAQ